MMLRHLFVHPSDVLTHPDGSNRLANVEAGETRQRVIVYAEHPLDEACGPDCVVPEDRAAYLAAHPDALIE